MDTKVVRLLAEDVERVNGLRGMPPTLPFAAKFHELLARLEGRESEEDVVRRVVREELERIAVGA